MNASQSLLRQIRLQRGLVFGVIIVTALFAFEMFNYSTTEHALSDLLGDSDFAGLRWATILAIAFCGIDFAGIARLFTPGATSNSSPEIQHESWYLFGAWLLAATMNAMLTWWGVSLAVLGHGTLGGEVVSRETMLRVVPVFVAVLVWLIRVLIIGTFSAAGEHLFNLNYIPENAPQAHVRPQPRPQMNPQSRPQTQSPRLPEGAQSLGVARASGYRNTNSSVMKADGRNTVNLTREMAATQGVQQPASQSVDPGPDHTVEFPNNRPERRYVPISNEGQIGSRHSTNGRVNGERSNTQQVGRS